MSASFRRGAAVWNERGEQGMLVCCLRRLRLQRPPRIAGAAGWNALRGPLSYTVIEPFDGVADNAVLLELVENLVVETSINAQRLIDGRHLPEHIDAVLRADQAIAAAVQQDYGVAERGGLLAQPEVAVVHGT